MLTGDPLSEDTLLNFVAKDISRLRMKDIRRVLISEGHYSLRELEDPYELGGLSKYDLVVKAIRQTGSWKLLIAFHEARKFSDESIKVLLAEGIRLEDEEQTLHSNDVPQLILCDLKEESGMTSQIKFWNVNDDDTLQELPKAKLDLEERLEAWIESDISVLSEELLIVGRQVETDYGGFIDLLCLDRNGDLVIIELKKGRTPRDVTAQAIDYASWVTDLSREDVDRIARDYLKDSDLESAFRARFGDALPEVINNSHSMVVVGSDIDSSTERIIIYLSDIHGVKINAAIFEYFKDGKSNQEYLGRVFLIEPSDVEQKAERKGTSKRKPKLTFEELDELAEKNGVGALYRQVIAALEGPLFKRRTQSSLAFNGNFETGRRVLFSLIPSDSSSETGLRYQVYLWRLAEYLGISPDDVLRTLPDNSEEWAYDSGADEDWSGYTGFFQNEDDVALFTSLFSEAID